jgi:hypothetical protein
LAKLGGKSGGKQFFDVWSKEANLAYNNLQGQIDLAITSLRAGGMSDQAIFARLKSDLDNQSDLFSAFSGQIEGANTDLFHLQSQSESNNAVDGASELFEWVLDPEADHCGDCIANAAKEPMSFADWESEGLPGMGNTECGEYCKCSLDPVAPEAGTGTEPTTPPEPEPPTIEPQPTRTEPEPPAWRDKTFANLPDTLTTKEAADAVWKGGGKRVEHAIATDADGNVLFAKKGRKSQVEFSQQEVQLVRGSDFLHNHPSGSSFSPEDLIFSQYANLKTMHAVGEEFHYTLTPINGRWPTDSPQRIKKDYRRYMEATQPKYETIYRDLVAAGHADATGATWRMQSNEIWEMLSKDLGVDYKRTRR